SPPARPRGRDRGSGQPRGASSVAGAGSGVDASSGTGGSVTATVGWVATTPSSRAGAAGAGGCAIGGRVGPEPLPFVGAAGSGSVGRTRSARLLRNENGRKFGRPRGSASRTSVTGCGRA